MKTIEQSLKRSGPLNVKTIEQSLKRNGPLDAQGIEMRLVGGEGGGGGGGETVLSGSGPVQNAFVGSIALGRQSISAAP